MNNEENNHGLEPDLPLFLMIMHLLSSSDFLQWCLENLSMSPIQKVLAVVTMQHYGAS